MYKTRKLVNWGSINRLQDLFTLWQVSVIFVGIGISSLDTKLFSVWMHKKQNKIHYIIPLVIVAKVIISLRKKHITWSRNFKICKTDQFDWCGSSSVNEKINTYGTKVATFFVKNTTQTNVSYIQARHCTYILLKARCFLHLLQHVKLAQGSDEG